MKETIAIDVDGTLRNLPGQLNKFLESDYPEFIDKYRELADTEYWALSKAFNGDKDLLYSWMYDQRVFELFGMAPKLHPKVIDDLNMFAKAANATGEYSVVIASVQRDRSITATLHWLSRHGCRVQGYHFFNSMQEKIDARFDYYVDDCPMVLKAVSARPERAIKIPYKFNDDIGCRSLDIFQGKFDDIYEMFGVEKILKK